MIAKETKGGPIAAVYLGSSDGNSPVYRETAAELGRRFAREGISIVYGGADVGTMAALADGALSEGGHIIGVFPEGFAGKKEVAAQNREIERKGLSEMIIVRDFAERKARMEEISDCCVALPGSIGTMDELFCHALGAEIGLHEKKAYVLNIESYYDHLEAFLKEVKRRGFLPEDADYIQFCGSMDELVKLIKNN